MEAGISTWQKTGHFYFALTRFDLTSKYARRKVRGAKVGSGTTETNTRRCCGKRLNRLCWASQGMIKLAGHARISFEGDLRAVPKLLGLDGAAAEETVALKRNTSH
jgi:hypothetical protein